MTQNALQIFHVNLNCADLDRSRAFYELIGFEAVNDFNSDDRTFAEIGLSPILKMPDDCEARAVLMAPLEPRSNFGVEEQRGRQCRH